MERLDARDRRFLVLCLVTIVLGLVVTAVLFPRAFPEASIEFRVNRGQARVLAEAFLKERGQRLDGTTFAGRFGVDDIPKVYLERELGLQKATEFYGREAKVWTWDMRWFRSGQKLEERAAISPAGDLVGFESVREENAPGPRPSREEARALAEAFLVSRGLPPATRIEVEASPISREKRTDWVFVDERAGFRMAEARLRWRITVSRGEVSAFREFVHVPEQWQRDYRRLRSKNEAAGQIATLGLFVTMLAMFGVLIQKIVRKDVRWRLVAAFGAVGFLLTLLSTLNGLPNALYGYDTASPLSSFYTNQVLFGILGAIGVGALIAIVVAAAEPIFRERFPQHLSLSGMFTRRGLRTKRVFLGLVLGWALTAFFFAYQAIFYVVAARFGAWAPADVPYSDMLNTAFPWATVLLIGFLPAVSEEGISRMFSISFLDKIGAGRLIAIGLPALIWGFGHAAYPNQPFYIRGLEVGLVGVVTGVLMVRFGVLPLLAWHFSVDAIYTAMLMLRSGNAYYVVSGTISAGILLLPLTVAAILYWKRGGFAAEAGLTNGEEGFVPPPPAEPEPSQIVPESRPVPRAALLGGLAAAAALSLSWLIPAPREDLAEDATGRARAASLARAFLSANNVQVEGWGRFVYPGAGWAEDDDVRGAPPQETGALPGFTGAAAEYAVEQAGSAGPERLLPYLPPAYWVARHFQDNQKEEWKVLVDARRSRVVGFLNPVEEAAPAPPAPPADRAKARAVAAAEALGYPAAEYAVVEVATEDRPKRRDTKVVLEATPQGVGQLRPRLTAVFHGPRMAAFYPSVAVPEEFLRRWRRTSVLDSVLLVVKIIGLGALVGAAIVLFLRLVRQPGFRWRALLPSLAVAAAVIAAASINSLPQLMRQYRTDMALGLWRVFVASGLLIGWMLFLALAVVGFTLLSGARPAWTKALRRDELAAVLPRALAAAAGLLGLGRVFHVAAGLWPVLFSPGVELPDALAKLAPWGGPLLSALRTTFLFAVAAGVAALAARRSFFQGRIGRFLGLAALLAAALPGSFHSPREFGASIVTTVALGAWLAFCAFVLLSDSPSAWLLFGAFAFGGRAAMELLSQPAGVDKAMGWAGLVLLAVGIGALLFPRARGKLIAEG